MKEKIIEDRRMVLRHSTIELAEHWLFAISGFILLFSGFGEFPIYKRFMLTQIPGLSWAGDFFINLKIHYLAGIVFVSVMVFHFFYHGWLGHRGLLPQKGDFRASMLTILSFLGIGEEPKAHKYLPEQRLAYVYLGGVGLVLVITGLIKVTKNLPGVYFPPTLITWTTLTHTVATFFFLFGVLAHLGALIFKVNRPLIRAILTGEVNLEYVQRRHPYWYEELLKYQKPPKEEKEAPETKAPDTPAQEKEEILNEQEGGEVKMISIWKVKGMSCAHCVAAVTKALQQLDGIEHIEIDLSKGEVKFANPKAVPPELIQKAITEAGYEVISGEE